jgi:hypothetical protein
MSKRIAFKAIMKKLEVKSLVSMDKGARLILDFNVIDDQLVADLNSIMKADNEVFVVIMEKAE